MIKKELKELIEKNALALATVDESDNPHCIAVADVKVISENQILIGNNYMIQTIKNIQQNNFVSLAVWNKDWEDNCIGYGLKGTAEYFTSGKWVEMVKEIHKGFSPKGAIVVNIKEIKKLA